MRDDLNVACERSYGAPAIRVYRAFTDPDLMRRWWSPDSTIGVDVIEWDLAHGGRWRFAYRFPDGAVSHVRGVFQDIVPERRLVFTWTWEPPDPHAGIETLVSVTFEEADGRTTVRVRHTRFPDDATCLRHDAGWNATLDRLPEVLT